MNMCFDLVDSERKVRDILAPKKLFEFWEWISSLYDKQQIGSNDRDEIRAVVWNQFRRIDALRQVSMTKPTRWLGGRGQCFFSLSSYTS